MDNKKYKLGMFLALLGIVAGLLTFYFLADTYNTAIHTHFNAGEWEESNTVRLVYALLGWLGTAAGALSVAVLWGFWQKQDWAWYWGAVAGTILLLAGFFPFPSQYVPGDRAFWNGMYVISQQINWWGAAAWAMFIFGAFKRRRWALPVGLFAATLSMLGGYPMGIHNVGVDREPLPGGAQPGAAFRAGEPWSVQVCFGLYTQRHVAVFPVNFGRSPVGKRPARGVCCCCDRLNKFVSPSLSSCKVKGGRCFV